MGRTYFHDFTRDNSQPVTVEYGMEDHGTCACILSCWPNTQEYNDLHARRQELTIDNYGRQLSPIAVSMQSPDFREELDEIDKNIDRLDEASRLTDVETERMEAWLTENYIPESDDFEF